MRKEIVLVTTRLVVQMDESAEVDDVISNMD